MHIKTLMIVLLNTMMQVDAKLLEFLLYQTGVLIRMVITTNDGGQV